jgi:ELWxxDGT repeat protein
MSPHPDAARSRTLLLPLLLTILGFVLPQTAGAFSAPALLKDINPGSAASTPTLLQPFGSKLFFLASDATTGTEAWVSDGTAAGTFELRDILPGAGSGLNPNGLGSVTAVIGGTVYFVAYDGTAGYQLWRTDGTTLGTSKVDAVDNAFGLNVIGGKVFFTNSNSALCVSDGTPGGTGPIGAAAYLNGTDMVDIGGIAYFQASDGFSGIELWRSNGTPAGTARVKDINPGSPDSGPTFLTNVGGTLYFYAGNATGGGIYKSDGTSLGTVLVKQLTIAYSPERTKFVVVNGILYFVGNEATHGSELWRTDGTTAGTYMVKDIYPGVGGGIGNSVLVGIGNAVYFAAGDDTHGYEIWKSDGTDAGTVMVKDIAPGIESSNPKSLANINGTLFFRAQSSFAAGDQVWTSDGTAVGTQQYAAVYPANESSAQNFTLAGGRLFFAANEGVHGLELWSAGPTLGVAPGAGANSLSLAQSQPNPMRAQAAITYAIAVGQHVTLKMYDAQGREVRTLIDQMQSAGMHRADVDASGLASGVYFYRLRTSSEVRERKLVIQQ